MLEYERPKNPIKPPKKERIISPDAQRAENTYRFLKSAAMVLDLITVTLISLHVSSYTSNNWFRTGAMLASLTAGYVYWKVTSYAEETQENRQWLLQGYTTPPLPYEEKRMWTVTHHAWPGAFAVSVSIFVDYVMDYSGWWLNLALLLVSLYCTIFLVLEVTRQKIKHIDDCPKGQLDYSLEHEIESPIILMAYLTIIAVTAALFHDSS